jgi:regulator of sirC expression with transglutaminase-like and TPR domain
MSSISGFQDFPDEVIEQILLFIPTPRAVCRVGATRSSLFQLVANNERIWDHMYKKRWSKRDSSITTYAQQHYKDQHTADGEILRQLQTVSQEIGQKEDYGLGREFTNQMWEDIYCNGDSFNVLRAVAKDDPTIKALYDMKVSPILKCVAAELMERSHFQGTLPRLSYLSEHLNGGNDNKIELLEEVSLLFSETMWTWQELLARDPDSRIRDTREMLDGIVKALSSRFDTQGTMEGSNPLEAVRALNKIMIEEMGFAGNTEDYYDVKNSSLYHVLKSRKGIPLTLAVIYKLVLSEVSIDVDIIGLPGHVVLGIPGTHTFVDVFEGGRVLSPEDCREIVQSYRRFEWREDYLLPLSVKDVLVRMLSNVLACLARGMQQTTSVRGFVLLVRTAAFRASMQGLAQNVVAPYMRSGYRFLDPKIFRHFGLLDDEKLTTCEEMSSRYGRDFLNSIQAILH